ncbi:MerR HTH family regulatory protein [Tissierella praeacuta DSM 18095]|uniref:MerR HTH family regulatory protein n=1 Tax=Tissierella praeacuta DSM 18095 TaxID=1123404 RepID=A0A1M4UDI7_9FIRM|nr:MerR family transcriptional regulator [Tissierella praeacuta]SHE54842.1 MerR HTH family regulatory protein [Tissierella praeacuta DSM 18095]SUP03969.1 Multidrug transporter activation protein [Tissierella praeacuta]
MVYTVHGVAKVSGVSINTLYHYYKIRLLMPERVAENGYGYYGDINKLYISALDFKLLNL